MLKCKIGAPVPLTAALLALMATHLVFGGIFTCLFYSRWQIRLALVRASKGNFGAPVPLIVALAVLEKCSIAVTSSGIFACLVYSRCKL